MLESLLITIVALGLILMLAGWKLDSPLLSGAAMVVWFTAMIGVTGVTQIHTHYIENAPPDLADNYGGAWVTSNHIYYGGHPLAFLFLLFGLLCFFNVFAIFWSERKATT